MSLVRRPVAAAACVLALAVPVLVGAPAAGSTTSPTPVPAPPEAPDVVLPVSDGAPAPSPSDDSKAVAAAVRKALGSSTLGSDVTAMVMDATTGDVVTASDETRGQTPASTTKTLTAITALTALGPAARLRTSVVTGTRVGEIVLVGGGDATLTRVTAGAAELPDGQSARPASLAQLARSTAKALRAAGVTSVTLTVDDSAFEGPRLGPGWPDSYVATGVVSPVSALSADGGRVSAGARQRDADPALAAGRWFAGQLGRDGITVTGEVTRKPAAAGARLLSSVSSPTVADLVERMLTESDNDLAEALAHLCGGALVGDPSFAGGAAATEQVVSSLGIPTVGLALVDGSGLSRRDTISARTLVGVLAAVVRDEPPVGTKAGNLWAAGTGLPVAGATGTLAERFDTPGTDLGRGVVRAKTGTLSGVVTLAGIVRDRTGRLRVFAFLADASPGPLLDAEAALDRAAAAVAAA